MWGFSKRNQVPTAAPVQQGRSTTKRRGDEAEAAALQHLQRHGLKLVQRNFKTPGRGGGEVDLIMRAADGTLVFVEVRQRSDAAQGGASESITAAKRRRIVLAARHYLAQVAPTPPCRFDVVLIQGDGQRDSQGDQSNGNAAPSPQGSAQLTWLRAAFDADASGG